MTTWTFTEDYEDAPSTTYDDSSLTYDQANRNYHGKEITTWENETKL